jgi:hypothetical protein
MIRLIHKFNLSTGRRVHVDHLKEKSALYSSTGWLLLGFPKSKRIVCFGLSPLVLHMIFRNLMAHQLYRQQDCPLPQHSSLSCCRFVPPMVDRSFPGTKVQGRFSAIWIAHMSVMSVSLKQLNFVYEWVMFASSDLMFNNNRSRL